MDVAWTLLEASIKALAVWLVCLLSRKVLDRIMSEKCLIDKCARSAAKRGLCLVCYSHAKRRVDGKEVTWKRLEELGLVIPESGPFDAAYDNAIMPQQEDN